MRCATRLLYWCKPRNSELAVTSSTFSVFCPVGSCSAASWKPNFYFRRSDDRPWGGRGESTSQKFVKTLNSRLPHEDSSVRPQTLGKRVSDDPRHFIFRRLKHKKKYLFCKTLNGRLPPEDSSDWPQTLGKRVSDDPQHFMFRRRKKKLGIRGQFFRV